MGKRNPQQRARYHHGSLPQTLVNVALTLVEKHGTHGFKLREAARRAGVDIAAVYRHFAGKDALLHAVADRGYDMLAAEMRAARDAAPTREARLYALFKAYVAFAVARPELFRLMYGPLGARKFDESLQPTTLPPPGRLVFEELEAYRADGLVRRSFQENGVFMWAAVHGLACLFADEVLPREILDVQVQSVMEGILRSLQ